MITLTVYEYYYTVQDTIATGVREGLKAATACTCFSLYCSGVRYQLRTYNHAYNELCLCALSC